MSRKTLRRLIMEIKETKHWIVFSVICLAVLAVFSAGIYWTVDSRAKKVELSMIEEHSQTEAEKEAVETQLKKTKAEKEAVTAELESVRQEYQNKKEGVRVELKTEYGKITRFDSAERPAEVTLVPAEILRGEPGYLVPIVGWTPSDDPEIPTDPFGNGDLALGRVNGPPPYIVLEKGQTWYQVPERKSHLLGIYDGAAKDTNRAWVVKVPKAGKG
jgi:hypothetical protein